ncbi:GWT1-domain-containing protein [Coniophora puteana RWD-64-598 SS2]|uniref:GPI-anchored wall transfer protein n=1 Tax=Coniophora puteana (strain RWD-64-598) TaxID=741705 RepID=A0A5M3MKI3_CONPW|nr:GWT1-domain-containing protein [Coniophora puteana RWD-64-598 SS2]EIW79576.1 GWT1-domain-containing protein [Coniophora puteana RWD-64-598 SS2]
MSSDYKSSKEAFVSGMTGSSVVHVNLVSAVALCSIALHSAIRTRFRWAKSLPFVVEWTLLVLPLLLSMTTFATSPSILSLALLAPTLAVISTISSLHSGASLPSKEAQASSSSKQSFSETISAPFEVAHLRQLPAITTYRAHMMLMTALAILAVDFPIFPRALAKCETYGVSLMDLGVGSFVFSQGVVSAIRIVKDPTSLKGNPIPKLKAASRKVAPIIALGLVRVALVKSTEYPEHVTEYGVHWNFFITMALLPFLEILLHYPVIHVPVAVLGLLLAVGQEYFLSAMELSDYVLDAPRTNIIAANKEGLASLLGYLAIHIMGLSLGTVILPPQPSYFRKQQEALVHDSKRPVVDLSAPRQNSKTITELVAYSAIWWALLAIVTLGLDVSRRMANLPYVLWITAFNTSFILGYYLLDLYFFPAHTSKVKDPTDPTGKTVLREKLSAEGALGGAPALFEAINKNGMAVFLLANVATGVVNLSLQTMYASDSVAMGVLSVYSIGVCGVAWVFRGKKLL